MFFVVGRGRLGQSLHGALTAAGHIARLVPGRDLGLMLDEIRSFPRPIVILAVPDQAIPPVAELLRHHALASSVPVVHLSGAASLATLEALSVRGNPVGSFHPMQSFSAPRSPEAFYGSVIGVDASSGELLQDLENLAHSLGATPTRVRDAQRPYYHAAAAMASNYLNSLAAEACLLLEGIGWSRDESLAALVPLMRGAVDNLAAHGLPQALIGPIRRGDSETVVAHLAAIRQLPDAGLIEDAYILLGRIALDLAVQAGLSPAEAETIARALHREIAGSTQERST